MSAERGNPFRSSYARLSRALLVDMLDDALCGSGEGSAHFLRDWRDSQPISQAERGQICDALAVALRTERQLNREYREAMAEERRGRAAKPDGKNASAPRAPRRK
jgi:hypothetical protein